MLSNKACGRVPKRIITSFPQVIRTLNHRPHNTRILCRRRAVFVLSSRSRWSYRQKLTAYNANSVLRLPHINADGCCRRLTTATHPNHQSADLLPESIAEQLAQNIAIIKRANGSVQANQARNRIRNLLRVMKSKGVMYTKDIFICLLRMTATNSPNAPSLVELATTIQASLSLDDVGKHIYYICISNPEWRRINVKQLVNVICSRITGPDTYGNAVKFLQWLPRNYVPDYISPVTSGDFIQPFILDWKRTRPEIHWNASEIGELLGRIVSSDVDMEKLAECVVQLTLRWVTPGSVMLVQNTQLTEADEEAIFLSGLHYGIVVLASASQAIGRLKDAQIITLAKTYNKQLLSALKSPEHHKMTENVFSIAQYMCWASFLISELSKRQGGSWIDYELTRKLISNVLKDWDPNDQRVVGTLLERKFNLTTWVKYKFRTIVSKFKNS